MLLKKLAAFSVMTHVGPQSGINPFWAAMGYSTLNDSNQDGCAPSAATTARRNVTARQLKAFAAQDLMCRCVVDLSPPWNRPNGDSGSCSSRFALEDEEEGTEQQPGAARPAGAEPAAPVPNRGEAREAVVKRVSAALQAAGIRLSNATSSPGVGADSPAGSGNRSRQGTRSAVSTAGYNNQGPGQADIHLQADAVIVGSGAGGGVAAAELARAGVLLHAS